MREILFRGQDFSGMWHYGLLAEIDGEYAKLYTKTKDGDVTIDISVICYSDKISEYTGLCDKNGTKIFEGDVLVADADDTFLFVVRCGAYSERLCTTKTNIGFYCDWISCHGLKPINGLMFWCDKCKVVGNIYDNPELIPSCQ